MAGSSILRTHKVHSDIANSLRGINGHEQRPQSLNFASSALPRATAGVTHLQLEKVAPQPTTSTTQQTKMSGETKVALVTGSSSGIGEATAKLLCKHGYRVTICGSNADKVNKVVADCQQLSSNKPLGLVLDFSDADNGAVAVNKTVEHFGRLDVLINNAGLYLKTDTSDPVQSYANYKRMMTINLDATIKCTLAALEHLKETKGNVVFVSSTASVMPLDDSFGYSATKAAMSMFAKSLSIATAPDVRVNVVSPGPVETGILRQSALAHPLLTPELRAQLKKNSTLLGRIGHVDEIAETILFLVSEKASFIHGHELFADGGLLNKPPMMMPPMNMLG